MSNVQPLGAALVGLKQPARLLDGKDSVSSSVKRQAEVHSWPLPSGMHAVVNLVRFVEMRLVV